MSLVRFDFLTAHVSLFGPGLLPTLLDNTLHAHVSLVRPDVFTAHVSLFGPAIRIALLDSPMPI